MKKVIKILLVIILLSSSTSVFADTKINLQIKTNTDIIYNNEITVSPCDSEGDGILKATPYCALVQSNTPSDWSGLWINSINNILNNDNTNGIYWMWLANLNIKNSEPTDPYNLSSKQYTLQENDNILFYYNTNPLDISIDNENPKVGQNIKITIKELGLDSNWNPIWNKAIEGKVSINSNSYDLDENGEYSLSITNTDTLLIKGQKDNFIDSKELSITPTEQTPPSVQSSSTGGGHAHLPPPPIEKIKFDSQKAFDFLISQQKENGSFGEDIYTDWTTISLSSLENQNQKIKPIIKLTKYLGETTFKGNLLTDYERHAMTLMSFGLNPYKTNTENYIKKIEENFDGKQFGNTRENNDDIFALIVLQNAGFSKEEEIIKNTISFILLNQKENGSWNESIDMTGAAIQALSSFSSMPEVEKSLAKAKEYLKQSQKDDGGFNNVSSTAWAIGGILALSEKPEEWVKNNNTPLDYLAFNQDTDGGIKSQSLQNKIWETAYALTAFSGKTWNQIMQNFEKPKPVRSAFNTADVGEEIQENEENKITAKKLDSQDLEKPSPKKNKIKTEIKKIPPISIPAEPTNTEIKTEKSWFKNFLNKIFSIF